MALQQFDRRALVARWRRMDADAAARVLRATTWSHLTGDQDLPSHAEEPIGAWEDEPDAPESMSADRRASVVASRLLTHDPRFAAQLRRLTDDPFSEDFQEFVCLLIDAAARAGAVYATHLDSARPAELDRLVRATAALLGVELLPDPPLHNIPERVPIEVVAVEEGNPTD